jgi:signal transduction protein with GAF and PtsI domain
VSSRNVSRMRAAEVDSSLATRELGFLVRLAQAAASTQRPDELLELIIREATSAMGTDVCSLYLLTPKGGDLLLTATTGSTRPWSARW